MGTKDRLDDQESVIHHICKEHGLISECEWHFVEVDNTIGDDYDLSVISDIQQELGCSVKEARSFIKEHLANELHTCPYC